MKFYVILRDKLDYNVNIVLYGFSGLRDCISWLKANYTNKMTLTKYPEFVIAKDKKGRLDTHTVYKLDNGIIKFYCHYRGV